MSLFDSVAGWFRRSRHTQLQVPKGSFEFAGKPGGEVSVLEAILSEGLRHDRGLRRAYLTLIRHAGEQRLRVALCLDTRSLPEDVIRPLSGHCAQYVSSIDIIFFSDLGQRQIEQLKSVVEPFYAKERNA